MNTFTHDVPHLFEQLGLRSDKAAINFFCRMNNIPSDVAIEDAGFWSTSQAAFLKESKQEDADWSEAVDTLDTMLR